jgi:ribosomal protein S18 acetylase RimI-like enzyme
MTAQIEVRAATKKDIASIIGLWNELMAFHREKDLFFEQAPNAEEAFVRYVEDNIASETACVFVAVVDAQLVGYCQGKLDKHPPVLARPDYGQILDVAVTADYRRTGVGEQMFAALRHWFCHQGVPRIEVRHWKFNEAGSRFWRKMGFEPYLETLFMKC